MVFEVFGKSRGIPGCICHDIEKSVFVYQVATTVCFDAIHLALISHAGNVF